MMTLDWCYVLWNENEKNQCFVTTFCSVLRYIEETILKTGVAIETQGYFFVVSGKKRDTLKVRWFLAANFIIYPKTLIAGAKKILSIERHTYLD